MKTFFNEFTTQSKTAFNFGTRLIVFNGRNTRNTRKDFIVLSLAVMSDDGTTSESAAGLRKITLINKVGNLNYFLAWPKFMFFK